MSGLWLFTEVPTEGASGTFRVGMSRDSLRSLEVKGFGSTIRDSRSLLALQLRGNDERREVAAGSSVSGSENEEPRKIRPEGVQSPSQPKSAEQDH